MTPEDLHTLSAGSEVTTDLCVIGAGPAGLAIARAFAQTRVRVLLLESGRLVTDAQIDGLGTIESDGAPREPDQTRVRNRIFGGSTQTWKGRVTAFANTDFEVRAWVPHSGWPIGLAEVEKYVNDAATFMALGPNVYDARLFDLLGIRPPTPELDPRLLQTFFWQFCNNLEFPYGKPPYGPLQLGREFLRAPPENVRVLVNATVTHLNTNPEGTRLLSLDLSSIEGTKVTVVPQATVLCGGGIENARLLLASNRIIAAGVGNAHDNVGRYLMDHLRLEVGDFALTEAEAIQDRFDFYMLKGKAGNRAYLPGFVLSRDVQKDEKLLHCSSWVEQTGAADDPWPAARSLLRRKNEQRLRDLKTVFGQSSFVGRGLYRSVAGRRGIRHKAGKLALMCMCEQIPDRDSRVVLSSRPDALGVPTSRIHWKVSDRELATMVRMAEIVAQAFKEANLPPVRLHDWVRNRRLGEAPIIDVAHPTGTTRMSTDPRDGVVDRDCKVHGVEGLYIAGSSVFPTAGHANPTLLLVGLALRLAQHLKTTTFSSISAAGKREEERDPLFEPAPIQASGAAGRLVLVTGGTGKIGRPLVAELLRRGHRVRLVTSRANVVVPGAEVQRMNWLETLDFAPAVAGCDAVLHLGAELHDEAKMERVNVDATGALAAAAEAAGVRFIGYASTVSVYGSPRRRIVTEESPVVDGPGERYLTISYLQKYAATKLAGERRIRDVARALSGVVYRPTVVVDIDMLESMRNWSRADRIRYGGRFTNHVYLGDVVAAMVWFMERALVAPPGQSGKIDVVNLADESPDLPTYRNLYAEAFRVTGDARFRAPVALPPAYDLVREGLRYRSNVLRPRYPLGMLQFPPRKLLASGFRHPYGLDAFYRRALGRLTAG